MASCNNCGKNTKFSYSSLIGGVTLCDECKELASPTASATEDVQFSDLDVHGLNLDTDEIPDDIKQQIIERIKEEGVNPENVHAIAVDIAKLEIGEDNFDELGKKFQILRARELFLFGLKAVLGTFHALHHAEVPESEIKMMVKRFSLLQYEIMVDYLFLGRELEFNEDELIDLNQRIVTECGKDGDDDD